MLESHTQTRTKQGSVGVFGHSGREDLGGRGTGLGGGDTCGTAVQVLIVSQQSLTDTFSVQQMSLSSN